MLAHINIFINLNYGYNYHMSAFMLNYLKHNYVLNKQAR